MRTIQFHELCCLVIFLFCLKVLQRQCFATGHHFLVCLEPKASWRKPSPLHKNLLTKSQFKNLKIQKMHLVWGEILGPLFVSQIQI